MKIAVTGKGGVGKTTISAVLARLYAEEGKKSICCRCGSRCKSWTCTGIFRGRTFHPCVLIYRNAIVLNGMSGGVGGGK